MNQKRLDRINELARKQKTIGLTEAEKAEQKRLRAAYLADFRRNLRGQPLRNRCKTAFRLPEGGGSRAASGPRRATARRLKPNSTRLPESREATAFS